MISRPCRTSYQSSPFSAIPSLVIRSMLSNIHVMMLLRYDVFDLPRLCFPFTFPWITHLSSSHPPSLIMCTEKESLRRTTNPRSCLVVLSSVRILSSVRCSVQLTRNIRRYIHSFADSILFSSASFLFNYSVKYYDYSVKRCSGVACTWYVSLVID